MYEREMYEKQGQSMPRVPEGWSEEMAAFVRPLATVIKLYVIIYLLNNNNEPIVIILLSTSG